ncbi:hypothetical protein KO507_06085 [Gilvimarinus agarilyticus]|uniref:hypothetical protein n=1 Tax=unclassified Gilvimarinus TaxID=2642066 RepID=UPI001C0A349A|nr:MULTISPECIES: hypothetical protein [unclassified Gilvimarinus]MBU2885331.1 hypothetical protein [Gilvimarinus agarilyticus]MDO6570230.1 hypothetical protein [Gilvimarinus sp. 2_MG-2023]MDO6748225.1 hypothetical protein [Gilvimarinus sp. 1_MG-2023]
MADYQLFLDGRNPLTVKDYSGTHSRRDVIEVILFQQALAAGGFEGQINFVPEISYRRSLRQLISGQIISTGTTKWYLDFEPLKQHLFITTPLIRDGEFLVGLYHLESRPELAQLTIANITEHPIITSLQWRADINAITTAGFNNVVYGSDWRSMLRMLQAGRGDIIAAPFPNSANLAMEADEDTLTPVQNIRLHIPGQRHWLVSQTHPQGQHLFQALQKGLSALREQGTVIRAYRQAGFFNNKTQHWAILPPTIKPADLSFD